MKGLKLEYFRPVTCKNDKCGESFNPKDILNYFKGNHWVGTGVNCPACESRTYFVDHRSKPQSKVVFDDWQMRERQVTTKQVSVKKNPNKITRKKAKSPKELEQERCKNCGWLFPAVRIYNGLCSTCQYGTKP